MKGFYGDFPDPSMVRVGNDYYMTHSSFDDCPGLQLWHSTDLMNWRSLGYALSEYIGNVWAPDLIRHNERFYIYFPIAIEGDRVVRNYVVTAEQIEGPWSDPVDVGFNNFIDPGHIADRHGNRFLYFSSGQCCRLSEDGLRCVEELGSRYEGWDYPETWRGEGQCLEGPKLFFRDGFYYMVSAQGGTAGPATSHMAICARSQSPVGPWENSPHNPVIRTESREEKWWSQGHGTVFEGPGGQWYIVYHAYRKGKQTLGRHTLIRAVEWTQEGWPVLKPDVQLLETSVELGTPVSRLRNWKANMECFQSLEDGFALQASGTSLLDCRSVLTLKPQDNRYSVQAEVDVSPGCTAGLCLFYSEAAHVALAVAGGKVFMIRKPGGMDVVTDTGGCTGLKIINRSDEVQMLYRRKGEPDWTAVPLGLDLSGFHHNTFGGFYSLKAGVFAFGGGQAVLKTFSYVEQDG